MSSRAACSLRSQSRRASSSSRSALSRSVVAVRMVEWASAMSSVSAPAIVSARVVLGLGHREALGGDLLAGPGEVVLGDHAEVVEGLPGVAVGDLRVGDGGFGFGEVERGGCGGGFWSGGVYQRLFGVAQVDPGLGGGALQGGHGLAVQAGQ